MALTECNECGKQVSDRAASCPHCGNPFVFEEEDYMTEKDFTSITKEVSISGPLTIKSGRLKRYSWFILANAAIVASLAIISGGALLAFTPILIVLGCTFPFFTLLLSRWLAKRSHHMKLLVKDNFESDEEAGLYELVESLCLKSGIRKLPQIGIYESDEVNAFATGSSKNRSLVAFSSGLLDSMDEKGIAAVAAHEVAHIANGDMVTLALVQSVVNTIIMLCTIPLRMLEWFVYQLNENASVLFSWLVGAFRFLLTLFLVFLGSLVVKAFSRKREFQADKLAAQLLDRHSMIHALETLKHDKPVILKQQKAYAAFKINSPRRWMDLLSTHPSLERRIEALKQLSE